MSADVKTKPPPPPPAFKAATSRLQKLASPDAQKRTYDAAVRARLSQDDFKAVTDGSITRGDLNRIEGHMVRQRSARSMEHELCTMATHWDEEGNISRDNDPADCLHDYGSPGEDERAAKDLLDKASAQWREQNARGW